MDYKLSELTNIKIALEDKILEGLTKLFNDFTNETKIAVRAINVDFIDVSTLDGVKFIPSKVKVTLISNDLLIGDKKDIYGKTQ